MRTIRYSAAMSLDGFIAGPNGEIDWIVMDPVIDFAATMSRYDTVITGRRSFEAAQGMGGIMPGLVTVVASRTLRQENHPGVRVVGKNLVDDIAQLRSVPGKDIWLFGGGVLFRSLLEARQVDEIDVGIVPVLLGAGVPLLPSPAPRVSLKLTRSKIYQATGTTLLEYRVEYPAG